MQGGFTAVAGVVAVVVGSRRSNGPHTLAISEIWRLSDCGCIVVFLF